MLENIQKRIAEIEEALRETVAKHSMLMGHLAEAKHFLEMAQKPVDLNGENCEKPAEEIKE